MQIKEIWRYPVKSMAGETLSVADINRQGIAGDRIIQVRNAAGRIFSARTRPKLLRHTAMLADNGDVLVDGRPWDSTEVALDVEEAAGAGTRLVRSDAGDRFDVLPLLVTTDGMFAAVGYDRRRFRPKPGHRRRGRPRGTPVGGSTPAHQRNSHRHGRSQGPLHHDYLRS
jgi:hypothetical protein